MVFIPDNSPPLVTSDPNDLYPSSQPPTGEPLATEYPIFGVAEDLLLALLKPAFEPLGVSVKRKHVEDATTPLMIVRASRSGGIQGIRPEDARFLRSYKVALSVITSGPHAERQGAQLIEAAQHVIVMAHHNQTVVPGHGHISHIDTWVDPVRVSDFQTATNIVQYPSLPRGHVRYEQNFNLFIRPDEQTHRNPFLANTNQHSKE